jgi:multidrug efflux system outer membrane protein
MNSKRTFAKASALGWCLPGLSLLLSACAVGPNHETPQVPAPEQHRDDEKPQEKSFADLPWWELYRDPHLFHLIRETTEKAYDLRLALARVEASRQAHRAAIWALAPTLGVQGGVGDAVGNPNVPGIYPPIATTGVFGASAVASWEPDIWGRIRRIAEVAEYEYVASDEERRGVYVALVGDVAELYFSLLSLDQQKITAESAVATRQETLTLFEGRSGGGVGNDLEVARARSSLEQARAAATEIALSIRITENALSFLLARAPGPISERSTLDQLALPLDIPAGLPSTLLQRRPDIRAADARLRSANARIGAEMADFFPKFELTGFLGVASPNLNEAQVIRGGAALFSWTLPFLGGERVRAEYDAARAVWRGATANYERVAMNSFREVADALATIVMLRERRVAVEAQLSSLVQAQDMALSRYKGGVADYLDVLTTQEQLLVTQLTMATLRGQQHIAVARLYRRLGGGWPVPIEEEEKDDEKQDKESAPPSEAQ